MRVFHSPYQLSSHSYYLESTLDRTPTDELWGQLMKVYNSDASKSKNEAKCSNFFIFELETSHQLLQTNKSVPYEVYINHVIDSTLRLQENTEKKICSRTAFGKSATSLRQNNFRENFHYYTNLNQQSSLCPQTYTDRNANKSGNYWGRRWSKRFNIPKDTLRWEHNSSHKNS